MPGDLRDQNTERLEIIFKTEFRRQLESSKGG
jgi:hypothetical protein